MVRRLIFVLILAYGVCSLHAEELISRWVENPVEAHEFGGGKQDGVVLLKRASGLVESIKHSEEFTVAFRFETDDLDQAGPARIVSISRNTSHRNFTIGQEKGRIEVRLRSTKTSTNGLPGFSTDDVLVENVSTHLALTRDQSGSTILYLNGEPVAKKLIEGSLRNWDPGFTLILGDEVSGGREWKGKLEDLAIYPRILSEEELLALVDGENLTKMTKVTSIPPHRANEELFETKVTTILTRHCLECHDSATADGDLDLSKALASHTDDGILVPGDAAASLLWESIELDDMPHKREPLSVEEKEIFREWIDGGAAWTINFIDPAIYSRPAEPIPARARRLTVTEYINTVRDVFGVDIFAEAKSILPPEVRADGFSNTIYNLSVDLKHIEGYSELAAIIVKKLDVAAFVKRFTNKRDMTDKTMISLIEEMSTPILRGPAVKKETSLYRGVSTSAASAGGEFDDAVGFVIEAMLQSPRFLYRLEKPVTGSRARRVSDYELASRLSYTIWGSAPDMELLNMAASRQFDREGMMDRQIERMLRDPRAVARSLEFCSEWLNLDRLAFLQPNAKHFPEWETSLAAEMKEETLRFYEEVVWKEQRPLGELLNAPFSFLSRDLAAHYGLESEGLDGELARVDLSGEQGRGGLLTHGSLLTIGGDEASMVSRGLFVLNDLLRGVIKDPPPCVDTTPIESGENLSRREVAMERVADSSCGGCHSKFEPLAYGLEKYDGLGSYMSRDEHGNVLREDGEVLFPGEAEPVAFESIEELMNLLAESSRVKETMTWKITQFALGRPLNAGDAGAVSQIHEEATRNGGRYHDVMTALAKSRLIRYAEPAPSTD
ncbi:MAG: DUF1592 domain-containing protein [Verrucomicrobiales bacterium]|nr:DUF1592 domain-containing protein [Verrucomicrobiales bacterium]